MNKAWARIGLILAFLLLGAGRVCAQGGAIQGPTIVSGVVRGGVVVTVCASNASVVGGICTLAESDANCCFTDGTLQVRLAVPPAPNQLATIVSDGLGNFQVWAAPGNYQMSFSGTGISAKTFNVAIGCVPGNSATCGAFTNAPNTWSAAQTFTNTATFTGASTTITALDGCQHVNASQSFAAALAAASAPGCIAVDPGTYTVSANATIGSTITLVSGSGGLLSIATGVTLTINGPIQAPDSPIFAYVGTGKVLLGSLPAGRVLAPWFPGADACVQINNAIASLPTLSSLPVGYVDIKGFASNAVVPCGTTVTATGSRLRIQGPGAGALRFNCTMTGDCWNLQEGANFSADPGFYVGGFSLIGQGSGNANAVGLHWGDMVGGTAEDIDIDGFTGASGACIKFENLNGFFERNNIGSGSTRLQLGLVTGVAQSGCTNIMQFVQPATAPKQSFSHNHFSINFSVAAGQTLFNFAGGNAFDLWIQGTGNITSGNTATIYAMSGLTFTGSGVNTTVDGFVSILSECTSPCTGGTLMNIPSGFTLTLRAGSPGFHEATSGLLTNNTVGHLNIKVNDETASNTNLYFTPFSGTNVYIAAINPPGASRVINWQDPLANANFAWTGNGTSNGGAFGLVEQATPSGLAASDIFNPDSTFHGLLHNDNNAGWVPLPKTVALTADWTCGTGGTVASCTSATIIGSGGGVPLTFTLPLVATSTTLECDGVVGQATADTANQWNLLTATNGATNVTASYSMATAATASAYGAVTDQASTTTTFQIAPSWTLGGVGTKMPFHVWAKIEGASASGTVLSLQLLAPTVGDLVTIYRGTACWIF